MTYLLDTGVWLWSVGEPARIPHRVQDVIADRGHDVFLSAVTSWEVAIKAASGKLRLPEPPDLYVPRRMASQGLRPLAVSHQHALAVFTLPAHHRDPFDRLLIAQAKVEDMTLITANRMFQQYPVQLLWAAR